MDRDDNNSQPVFSDSLKGHDQYHNSSDSLKDPFIVEIKPSATETNRAVAELAEGEGELLEYVSRQEAELHVDNLTEQGGGRVALQKVAQSDSTSADVYLVSRPERNVWTPVDPDADTWVFGVGANQYGAIGEALIKTPGGSPPALKNFIERDVDCEEDAELHISMREDMAQSKYHDTRGRPRYKNWLPDCVVEVEKGYPGELIREYWCEIKTGNSSFERNQVEWMEQKASESGITVLKIRVGLDDLPDQYSVRFDKVD